MKAGFGAAGYALRAPNRHLTRARKIRRTETRDDIGAADRWIVETADAETVPAAA